MSFSTHWHRLCLCQGGIWECCPAWAAVMAMEWGDAHSNRDRTMKTFPEELGNDHWDQVMLMRGVGCPCWQHPGSKCSALSAPISHCRNCTLHFWHPLLCYPRAPGSGLRFSPTPPMAASAFATNRAQSSAICRVGTSTKDISEVILLLNWDWWGVLCPSLCQCGVAHSVKGTLKLCPASPGSCCKSPSASWGHFTTPTKATKNLTWVNSCVTCSG